ncbi:MAG: glutathione S-transferase family protein [Betaproteobacteria bacterium]
MKLFGAPGCGSAVVEVVLQMANQPYDYVQTSFWEQNEHFDSLLKANPQAKVPTVVLDDGTVMTESAAMVLFFSEKVPGLIPADPAQRAAFLRWMIFIPANIYAMFDIGDEPSRWVEGEETQKALKEKSVEKQKFFWGLVEQNVAPSPYVLGLSMSALDLYIAMVSRWRPGRAWFNEHCPKLAGAVALTEQHPVVAKVWEKNFGK